MRPWVYLNQCVVQSCGWLLVKCFVIKDVFMRLPFGSAVSCWNAMHGSNYSRPYSESSATGVAPLFWNPRKSYASSWLDESRTLFRILPIVMSWDADRSDKLTVRVRHSERCMLYDFQDDTKRPVVVFVKDQRDLERNSPAVIIASNTAFNRGN